MKSRLFSSRSSKVGLTPGELVYVGQRASEPVTVTVIDYDDSRMTETVVRQIEECFPFRDSESVSWINVNGLNNMAIIEKLGNHFGIHSLTLEDIVNTEHRPKIEDLGDYLYINLKMIYTEKEGEPIQSEQISLILGPRFVISFQEHEGDVFRAIRDRIRTHKGRIRKMGTDYLAYTLMDAIVDNYFVVLETLGNEIEQLEEMILGNPERDTVHKLHQMKGQLLFLRKSVWPVREILNSIMKSESVLIRKQTNIYLRDVYDHGVQIIDMMETMRDMNQGLFDMYLSNVSNRMNEVMKVLTIIATIFIPLTFIAGIYGMNFEFMPELKWPWGYFAVLGMMAGIAGFMIAYFKRKHWL